MGAIDGPWIWRSCLWNCSNYTNVTILCLMLKSLKNKNTFFNKSRVLGNKLPFENKCLSVKLRIVHYSMIFKKVIEKYFQLHFLLHCLMNSLALGCFPLRFVGVWQLIGLLLYLHGSKYVAKLKAYEALNLATCHF